MRQARRLGRPGLRQAGRRGVQCLPERPAARHETAAGRRIAVAAMPRSEGRKHLEFATRPTFAAASRLPSRSARRAAAAETPKRGGTLTYMISADAPPSFDGHREQTFATVQATAPFYSVLIRVNPENPSSNDFVCDLCTEMPKPTDDGKTYTFKIRDGVKFHDGTPLTAADVAANWQQMIVSAGRRVQRPRSIYQR